MKRFWRAGLVAIACIALASCSSLSAANPATPLGASPVVPSVPAAGSASRARRGRVTIRIRVPRGAKRQRVRVVRDGRPQYVSASTQALRLSITGPTTTSIVMGTVALAKGCSSELGALVCTSSVDLSPCSTSNCYTATATAYDGYDAATNTIPSGADALSIAEGVTFSVQTGQANQIGFTLSGIPWRIALAPTDGETTVATSSIQLAGVQPHVLHAHAYDVDGNLIVGGGSPSYAFAVGNASAVTKTSQSGGRVELTPQTFPSSTTLTVTASYPAGETDPCSLSNASCSATYTLNVRSPFTLYTNIPSALDPAAIARGPDGNLWFTDYNGGSVDSITESGTVTRYTAGITSGARLEGIAVGSDGNLWFAETNEAKIGRISTQGAVTEFSSGITPGSEPFSLALGADGNIWFSEYGVNRIGKITPSGTITEYSSGITGQVDGITLGPDGNIWYVETGSVGKITTAGVVTEYTTGSGIAVYIVAGSDGNLWFNDYSGYVDRVTTSGAFARYNVGLLPGAEPYFVTLGPDGNVWFTDYSQNAVGRITPSGDIKEIPMPSGNSSLEGIVAGYDGNLWFLENSPNAVVRMQL